MTDSLHELVKKKLTEVQSFFFGHYIQKIFDKHPKHISAILIYGSYLNESTRTKTSTPDFYVVVDHYKSFYDSSFHSFLNRHLPPNIYHLQMDQDSYKYCVISMKDLKREVSDKAKDVYHLGRFSKHMGLIFSADENAKDQIVDISVNAVRTVTQKVIQSLKKDFTLDEFIQKALFLSYQGDVRIEASNKVLKLMSAEKSYYDEVYSLALEEVGYSVNAEGRYTVEKTKLQNFMDQITFNDFITTSKLRARGRWPKNMFTVDNWLDYMIAKIDRTQGIKIELSPTERKYWYVFGWKYFFRLWKKNLIK